MKIKIRNVFKFIIYQCKRFDKEQSCDCPDRLMPNVSFHLMILMKYQASFCKHKSCINFLKYILKRHYVRRIYYYRVINLS